MLRLGSTRSYTSSMYSEPVRYRILTSALASPSAISARRQADKAAASSLRACGAARPARKLARLLTSNPRGSGWRLGSRNHHSLTRPDIRKQICPETSFGADCMPGGPLQPVEGTRLSGSFKPGRRYPLKVAAAVSTPVARSGSGGEIAVMHDRLVARRGVAHVRASKPGSALSLPGNPEPGIPAGESLLGWQCLLGDLGWDRLGEQGE